MMDRAPASPVTPVYALLLPAIPCAAFAREGRVREGMDADPTPFYAGELSNRSTYQDPTVPAAGIRP